MHIEKSHADSLFKAFESPTIVCSKFSFPNRMRMYPKINIGSIYACIP